MTRLAQCGMLGCKRIFVPRGNSTPAVFTCPDCEVRMNQGIKVFLHTHTEKVTGNFNLLEKINGSIHLRNH